MGNDAKVLLNKTAFKTLPLPIVLDFVPEHTGPGGANIGNFISSV